MPPSRSMAHPKRLSLLLVVAAMACDPSTARLLHGGASTRPRTPAATPSTLEGQAFLQVQGPRTPAAIRSRLLQAEKPPTAQANRLDQVHRPLRLTPRTATALVLSLVVAALSNAAGVGGGAIFVPLFVALLAFPVK